MTTYPELQPRIMSLPPPPTLPAARRTLRSKLAARGMKFSKALGWGGNGYVAWVHKPGDKTVVPHRMRKDIVVKINHACGAAAAANLRHENDTTYLSFIHSAGHGAPHQPRLTRETTEVPKSNARRPGQAVSPGGTPSGSWRRMAGARARRNGRHAPRALPPREFAQSLV
jgi:hypothetical protein